MYKGVYALTFPAILSISIPIVMRDGNAWGLMMMSGDMPESVKGMSTCVIGCFNGVKAYRVYKCIWGCLEVC